jgi:glutamate N-acetyltransferase / amino-acid N-acetyltransferase
MAAPVSPLAPAAFPGLPAIGGVAFAAAEAGIKYRNRRDVLLAVFDKGTRSPGSSRGRSARRRRSSGARRR